MSDSINPGEIKFNSHKNFNNKAEKTYEGLKILSSYSKYSSSITLINKKLAKYLSRKNSKNKSKKEIKSSLNKSLNFKVGHTAIISKKKEINKSCIKNKNNDRENIDNVCKKYSRNHSDKIDSYNTNDTLDESFKELQLYININENQDYCLNCTKN